MFTVKFYEADGFRQRIFEADSVTVLRPGDTSDSPTAEITLHMKGGDVRFDIGGEVLEGTSGLAPPPRFQKAIIENSAGRTTEIVVAQPRAAQRPESMVDKARRRRRSGGSPEPHHLLHT